MKKFFTIFILFIVYISTFSLFANASNGRHWLYPKQIKTYIPPNHKRTLMMQHAFAEWTRLTNERFIFRYVQNPENAQIRVFFVSQIPNADREIGLTKSKFLSTGKMVHADIYIAEKTIKGFQLRKDSIYTVMLHEIGHAIGINEHSENPLSIMHATEDDKQEILKSDLQHLYSLYNFK